MGPEIEKKELTPSCDFCYMTALDENIQWKYGHSCCGRCDRILRKYYDKSRIIVISRKERKMRQ